MLCASRIVIGCFKEMWHQVNASPRSILLSPQRSLVELTSHSLVSFSCILLVHHTSTGLSLLASELNNMHVGCGSNNVLDILGIHNCVTCTCQSVILVCEYQGQRWWLGWWVQKCLLSTCLAQSSFSWRSCSFPLSTDVLMCCGWNSQGVGWLILVNFVFVLTGTDVMVNFKV